MIFRLSMLPVKQVPGDAGPELCKGVAAQPSCKTKRGALAGIAYAGFAVSPPCVGKEIIAGNAEVSGIGRSQISVGSARGESHHDYVPHPPFEGLAGGAEIPWVFFPESANRRLHGIAGGDAGEPHPIAFAEALPMGPVLTRTVQGRAQARREQAASEAYRTDRALDRPIQPLPACERLIRGGSIPECLCRLLRGHLTRGASGYEKQNRQKVSPVWFHRALVANQRSKFACRPQPPQNCVQSVGKAVLPA